MADPQSPFKLNRGRVLILILGAIVVLIALSSFLGGITAYQHLREASQAGVQEVPATQP